MRGSNTFHHPFLVCLWTSVAPQHVSALKTQLKWAAQRWGLDDISEMVFQ